MYIFGKEEQPKIPAVIHMAGGAICVKGLMRQRCCWCGACLVKGVEGGHRLLDGRVTPKLEVFEEGELVQVEEIGEPGKPAEFKLTVVEHDGAEPPENFCAMIEAKAAARIEEANSRKILVPGDESAGINRALRRRLKKLPGNGKIVSN